MSHIYIDQYVLDNPKAVHDRRCHEENVDKRKTYIYTIVHEVRGRICITKRV